MPLRDFACQACGHRFEELVDPDEQISCPQCAAPDPVRVVSGFAVGGGGIPADVLDAARITAGQDFGGT